MAKNNADSMAAELLAVSSGALSAYASNRFLEKLPDAKMNLGQSAFGHWKDHFAQRIKELSVALAENEPALFLSRIDWSRAAFQAREVSEQMLRESLVCLGEVLEEELPEEYRQASTKYITAALKTFESTEQKNTGQKNDGELDSKNPMSLLAKQYLLQALEGQSGIAIAIVVDAYDKGLTIENAYQVLMTAQSEVGRMWHQAEVNIAEEHLVTSTTRRAMSALAQKAKKQDSNGLTVVSASVAGNSHDIGVRVVSDFFEFAGWRSLYLGGDLPAKDIAQAIEFFGASLVLLSAALSTQLDAVRETAKAIRILNSNCKNYGWRRCTPGSS